MTRTTGPHRWIVMVIVAACSLLFAGGTSRADDKGEKAPETRTGVLASDRDSGKTVDLLAKEHLIVSLPFNAGTGFEWKVKQTPKELQLANHFILKPVEALPIGGQRLSSFDFVAAAAGSGTLEIELLAPGGKVDKTVKLTVNVKGK